MQFSDVFEPNVSVLVSMEGGGVGGSTRKRTYFVVGNGWRLLIHIND